MKSEAIVAIIVTMLLVGMVFYVLPVKAQQYLKIGIIGPAASLEYEGMVEGAELAADWINGPGGGIVIGGTRYDVSFYFGDETPTEMERLITVEQVDLVLGGFTTVNVLAIREVAMDYRELFFIGGSSTNELVDCGTGTCGACVRCDYARYKYLFRAIANDTTYVRNFLGFLRGYVLPSRLVPLYGVQLDDDPELDVKTAVIAEDLDWTVGLYNMFVYGGYLGPHANIVYSARTPPGIPDFVPYLDAMNLTQVRLIVHLFRTQDGVTFISQWATHPVKAIPVGIDVRGQLSVCQYETLLAATGTRTPISTTSQPYTTVEFLNLYNDTYGEPPIYASSFGAYEAIIAMHDMLEAQTAITPPFDTADADALVPLIEATDRESVLGRSKYTQYHEPFSNEYGSTWTQHYVRPLFVQCHVSKLEVVWPRDQSYSKYWALPDEPSEMYPYPPDIDQDGDVDILDALFLRAVFGTYYCHPRWQFVADIDPNGLLDLYDALMLRIYFGRKVELPLAYCDEANHWI